MNKRSIVNLTNKVSIVAIFLLLYWVFIFGVSTIFGFKIFKENLTESFLMSILGILALLTGAVIVNIMFNMTIISESFGEKKEIENEKKPNRRNSKLLWAFILSFPTIALFLYLGDMRTSGAKERHLIKSAKYLIENNSTDLEKLADYTFDSSYIELANRLLNILSKQDESFPSMDVVVKDTIENKEVFLQFGRWFSWKKNGNKSDYIYSCSPDERKYLKESFDKKSEKPRFSSADGNYELYYPVKTSKGFLILYFTDHQRYGKFGS
jgi:hypothetical protein